MTNNEQTAGWHWFEFFIGLGCGIVWGLVLRTC